MNLTAQERTTMMQQILRRENGALAEFVIELAEFDRLEQYLDMGYRSLWEFCRRELGLSERAIYYRIAAAREIQKSPELANHIRDGRLCVTTLAMLTRILTKENAAAVVAEAAGKSKREVERMIARLDRKGSAEPSPGKVRTEVLGENVFAKYMTVDTEFEELLGAARDALSHSKPGASEVDILKEGLRRIIKDAAKRKGVVDKPRKDRQTTDGNIPRSVRREVWKRDEGKCQWRTADGKICGATYQIEFHHRQDQSKGGLGSSENIMLLCKVHNDFAARLSYGEDAMKAIRQAGRSRARKDTQPEPAAQLDAS